MSEQPDAEQKISDLDYSELGSGTQLIWREAALTIENSYLARIAQLEAQLTASERTTVVLQDFLSEAARKADERLQRAETAEQELESLRKLAGLNAHREFATAREALGYITGLAAQFQLGLMDNQQAADALLLIEKYHGKLEWKPYYPDGSKTDRVWWVCFEGFNPFRGATIVEAVERLCQECRITPPSLTQAEPGGQA